MRTVDTLLADAPAFEDMDPEHLRLLSRCARNVHFPERSELFREGDPADAFYLLRHGSVALQVFVPGRGAVTIETLEPGELVGWSWIFAPHRWQFDGRALTDVRATAFDGACLRARCEADHELGYQLMSRSARVLVERLQATRLRLLDVYGDRRAG